MGQVFLYYSKEGMILKTDINGLFHYKKVDKNGGDGLKILKVRLQQKKIIIRAIPGPVINILPLQSKGGEGSGAI